MEKFKMKENKTIFIHLKEFVCKITTNRTDALLPLQYVTVLKSLESSHPFTQCT